MTFEPKSFNSNTLTSPSPPTPHGHNSSTFHPPLIDGTLCVPELFEYHAQHSPDHPLFVYADNTPRSVDGNDVHAGDLDALIRTIKYPEAWRMILRASRIVKGHYARFEDKYALQDRSLGIYGMPQNVSPTIGILANADSISFFCTIVGIMRLGLTPFPLSVRNSPVAVAHLIKKTQLLQVFVSPDPAMQRLVAEARDILKKDGLDIEVMDMIQFEDLQDKLDGTGVDDVARLTEELELQKINMDDTAVIIHSSGTTSFPKAVYLSHRVIAQSWCKDPLYWQRDMCGTIMTLQACPLYHGMGMVSIFWTGVSGLIMAVFKPASPPTIATPEAFMADIIRTKSEVVFCVPSFIEAWAQDLSNFKAMKSVHTITYGGAPMEKSIGDEIVKLGLDLYSIFGLTEAGFVNICFPSEHSSLDTWEWFEFSSRVQIEFLPQRDDQEGNGDLFELCFIDNPSSGLAVTNAESSDGRPMYRTFDIVQRHPTYPQKWRIYGRADDQIMLSTGEKTNPGPLESILVRDPRVAAAIMFGRGQIQNGVLVHPKPEYVFDPTDEKKLIEFRNLIWPTVEKMNEFAPAHSKLFKEMITVSTPSKPFEYNSKGNPRRHFLINEYEPEIQALYATIKESSQPDIAPPEEWDEESVLLFVRRVVTKVMEIEIADNADLFLEGCDSLKATYIRNAIMHALRQPLAQAGSRARLPNNFIYSNPTISALSSFIVSLFGTGSEQDSGQQSEREAKGMVTMVEKYAADFPVHKFQGGPAAKTVDEVVLVSGTSGRLGAHLLAQLLARPSVVRVYAVNRPSREGALPRQRSVFENWDLDAKLLDCGKMVLLEADFSKPDFGVGKDVYNEIRDSVTSIIHNAWRVDFNVALSGFEPLISGVRNLIDLSLSSPRPSPPPIVFTSSISVIIGSPIVPVPEVPVTDPQVANFSGYSRSKWVVETLLLKAKQERALCVNVVRVGQMSGDTKIGGWNEKEWVPVMLRGSQKLGTVPDRDEDTISWIPVDTAASAIIEFIGSPEPVLHLVHPHPVPWTVVSSTASELLSVPIVPFGEWMSMLRDAATQDQNSAAGESEAQTQLIENPALKIFDFFEKGMAEISELAIATDKAVEVSRSLKEARELGRADVERWVGYWRKIGFLKD